MQPRERHLADWVKGEGIAVPRDHIPLSGHSDLTRLTVSDKIT